MNGIRHQPHHRFRLFLVAIASLPFFAPDAAVAQTASDPNPVATYFEEPRHPAVLSVPVPANAGSITTLPDLVSVGAECGNAIVRTLASTPQDPPDQDPPDQEPEERSCPVEMNDFCIECESAKSAFEVAVENGVALISYCVTDAACTITSISGGTAISLTTKYLCFNTVVELNHEGT